MAADEPEYMLLNLFSAAGIIVPLFIENTDLFNCLKHLHPMTDNLRMIHIRMLI